MIKSQPEYSVVNIKGLFVWPSALQGGEGDSGIMVEYPGAKVGI